jgi:hypothetical protein
MDNQYVSKRISAVDIVTRDRGIVVRLPAGLRMLPLLQNVQTRIGAHLTSYSLGTRCSFPGDRMVGAWSLSLTSLWGRDQGRFELHIFFSIRLHCLERKNFYRSCCGHFMHTCVQTHAGIWPSVILFVSTNSLIQHSAVNGLEYFALIQRFLKWLTRRLREWTTIWAWQSYSRIRHKEPTDLTQMLPCFGFKHWRTHAYEMAEDTAVIRVIINIGIMRPVEI